MIVIAGVVIEVDQAIEAESMEGLEQAVKQVEDTVSSYLLDQLRPIGTVTPLKVWVSGEVVAEIRAADFLAKHERAKHTPEYGLLPAGKDVLDERLQEAAESAAAQQQAGNN